MNKNFKLWKRQALEKLDKSHIGSIDKHIKSLCNTINEKENLFTLSSCSGRVCLLSKSSKSKEKNCWLYMTHELADREELKQKITKVEENKIHELRQESAIIHVCCENLELAGKIMHLGKISGFNQVGIIAIKNKIVIELICDIQYIVPLKKGLVSDLYLKYFISEANENMHISWRAIDNLEKEISKL